MKNKLLMKKNPQKARLQKLCNRSGFALFFYILFVDVALYYLIDLWVLLTLFFSATSSVTVGKIWTVLRQIHSELFSSGVFSDFLFEFILILSAVIIFWPYKRKNKIQLHNLFYMNQTTPKSVFLGISVVSLINFVMTNITYRFISWINTVTNTTGGYYDNPLPTDSPFAIIGSIVISVIIAPIFEEVLFRGVLLQPFRKYGDLFAVIVSGVLFGLFHANLIQIPFAAITGILFGILVVKYNSIWPAIFVHMLNNFISCISEFGEIFGNYTVTILDFLFYLLCFIGIIVIFRYFPKLHFYKGETELSFWQKTTAFLGNPGMLLYIGIVILLVSFSFV